MDASAATAGLGDGTRVVVTRGAATREEVAALVVALDAAARADAAGGSAVTPAPAWLRAARIEGMGGRGVAAPADLRGPR